MEYHPGTHLIATFETNSTALLERSAVFRQLVDQLVAGNGLQKLGEVYHDFDPAGFTAVICLSESHLSIHTWPEFNKVNIDIYLSNYLRDNDGTVDAIYTALCDFFSGRVVHEQKIKR
jgi:S-adenosylmethionine decarboxylase